MIWSCKDFLQILVLLRCISRALTELWKSMFENLQFFDWRTVTSKARSAAGKHFLITNKVLGSISRIIALRWHEKYYRKSISKDYRACVYNFSSIKVVVFTLSKWPKALYTIILPQVVLNRASLPTEVRQDVWKFWFLNK